MTSRMTIRLGGVGIEDLEARTAGARCWDGESVVWQAVSRVVTRTSPRRYNQKFQRHHGAPTNGGTIPEGEVLRTMMYASDPQGPT